MFVQIMKIGAYEIQVPFVTTSAETTKKIVSFAELYPGDMAVDLGSGDGRVILELAKAGLLVHGYEIKADLVERARQRIKEANLEERATIFYMSFWDVDLSSYDVVYIYGMQSVMGRLQDKLLRELRPGAKVITNIFRFPNWRAKKESHHLHLYIKT